MKRIALCLALIALGVSLQAANTTRNTPQPAAKGKTAVKAEAKVESKTAMKVAAKADADAACCGMSCCAGGAMSKALMSPKAAEQARR